jgi:transcriptional regulator with XRE-family HTH domain
MVNGEGVQVEMPLNGLKTGRDLREYRIERGLTQTALGKAMGITGGYVSNVENQDKTLDPKWVRNLDLKRPTGKKVKKEKKEAVRRVSSTKDLVLALLELGTRERAKVIRAVEVIEGL